MAFAAAESFPGRAGQRPRNLVLRAGPRPYVDIDSSGNIHFSCSRCGAGLKAEWLFCQRCKAGIGWVRPGKEEYLCGGCGEPLERDWRFCPACTTPIDWD